MNMLGRVVRTVAFKDMAVMRAVPVRSLQDFGGATDKLVGANTSSKPKKPNVTKDDRTLKEKLEDDDIPVAERFEELIKAGEDLTAELRGAIKKGELPKDIGKLMIAQHKAHVKENKKVQRRYLKSEELRLAKEKEGENEGGAGSACV